ncbi:hypothetical protein BH23ACT10_BH23ACT10_20980 [soil metagenome]
MEVWDREAIELLGPAFIEFGTRGGGCFRFIAVQGWMDCRYAVRDGHSCVEFTWDGDDDGDRTSGRGWALLERDGSLRGRIYLHLADDSGFRAVRAEARSDTGTSAARGRR